MVDGQIVIEDIKRLKEAQRYYNCASSEFLWYIRNLRNNCTNKDEVNMLNDVLRNFSQFHQNLENWINNYSSQKGCTE